MKNFIINPLLLQYFIINIIFSLSIISSAVENISELDHTAAIPDREAEVSTEKFSNNASTASTTATLEIDSVTVVRESTATPAVLCAENHENNITDTDILHSPRQHDIMNKHADLINDSTARDQLINEFSQSTELLSVEKTESVQADSIDQTGFDLDVYDYTQ
jgi:hypothetical protein